MQTKTNKGVKGKDNGIPAQYRNSIDKTKAYSLAEYQARSQKGKVEMFYELFADEKNYKSPNSVNETTQAKINQILNKIKAQNIQLVA